MNSSNHQSAGVYPKLYIVFLALLAATPAMATDMYLAAIPTIALLWHTTESIVSRSLSLWFICFSLFLLVCGPLSDKFGRKPVLLTGLAVFVLSSFLCATAGNVWQLILFRMLQGSSAAAPSSMCMAICRDRYQGNQRKVILAWIGIILSLTPMLAPAVGSTILKYAGWQTIFITQGTLGAILLLLTTRFNETVAEKITLPLQQLAGRYGTLLRNQRYLLSTVTMGLLLGPFYGFIGFSSILYMTLFGLSSQSFSLLFGLNAAAAMLGAFACTRLNRFVSDHTLLTVCFVGCLAAGIAILDFGSFHYLTFALMMGAYSFCCGMSRPLSNHLILAQVRTDIGSASAFLVFYQFIVGGLCMSVATAHWSRPFLVFGLITFFFPLLVLILWPFLLKLLADNSHPDF